MKKKLDIKKLVLLNLPYVFAFYFVDKLAAVFRLAPGTEFIDKLTGGFANFGAAFANPLPSFHPVDLLIGVAGGALLKLAVYIKGKNRKKFRQGEEYGSARWGRPEDIRPYMDDDFSNNVILTQTEGLTMNSRPKQPKYARNKNILVIGGSGSGKTRFFVKPNLMQMHSSYVVTDPKGTVLVECGKMLEKNGYIIKSLNTINFRKSIDLYNTSETRSTNNSYGLNYQKTGKQLMSEDEIAVMDGGKCILQLRGVRPFLSDKYDITKHPKYKMLSDYDKRNAFDIEKYRSHKLVVKPTQTFDLYDMGEVEAD